MEQEAIALLRRVKGDMTLRAKLEDDGVVPMSSGLWQDLCAFLSRASAESERKAAGAGAKGNANAEASVPSTPARPAPTAPATERDAAHEAYDKWLDAHPMKHLFVESHGFAREAFVAAYSAERDATDADVPRVWPQEAMDGPRSEPEALVAWLGTARRFGADETIKIMQRRLDRLGELRAAMKDAK